MSPDSDSAPAMTLDPALLEILCCPETKQAMTLLDAASLEILNRKIANGEVQNTGGNHGERKKVPTRWRVDPKR